MTLVSDILGSWEEASTNSDRSIIVGQLCNLGYKNREIRELLSIEKDYSVSYYKHCSFLSPQEHQLWRENEHTLTMSHIRSIIRFSAALREQIIRYVISTRISSKDLALKIRDLKHNSTYEQFLKGTKQDFDVKAYSEQVSEKLGREVEITFNNSNKCGSLTFKYYGLDDLERLLSINGFESAAEDEDY